MVPLFPALLPSLLACAAPSAPLDAATGSTARLTPVSAAAVDPTTAAVIVVDRWYASSSTTTVDIGPATAVGDVNGDGYPDVLLGAGDRVFVYFGSASGPSPSADREIVVSGVSSLGSSIAWLGDVNGDGYGDFVAGAPSGAGQAHVFYGAADGPDEAASDWSVSGTESGEGLGSAVAAAGDVNGDGYDDLLVGSYHYDGSRTDQGRAQLFLGGASGLEAAASWTATGGQTSAYLGYALAGVGDVDGDGYNDVLVGAYGYDDAVTDGGRVELFTGSASGLSTSSSWTYSVDQAQAYTGSSVGGLGDLDGDGYDDVVIGSRGYDGSATNGGLVELFTGSASGLGSTAADSLEGATRNDGFGQTLLAGPDLNGDGVGDLVLGTSNYVYIYLDTASGFPTSYSQRISGTWPGGAGDVDADGYADLFWGYSLYGSIAVYDDPGTADGVDTDPSQASWIVDSYTTEMGLTVGDADDINGDGYGDLVVGNLYTPFLALGSPDGYDHGDFSYLGYSSGAAASSPIGDSDGDGYDDVVVCTSYACTLFYGSASGASDSLSLSTSGSAVASGDFDGDGHLDFAVGNSGSHRTDVWMGTASGVTAAYDLRLSSTSGSLFGQALATGDFDGDGADDLVVGAPDARVTLSAEGTASVFMGSSTGLSTTADVTIAGDSASANCGTVAAGDVNGDGYDDLVLACPSAHVDTDTQGQVRLYLGSASGLETTESWTFDGQAAGDAAGTALAVADFTGDGYADVAIDVPGDDSFFDADTGYVALFVGSSAGLADTPDLVFVGHYTGFGADNSLAAITSPDGDGTPDLGWGVPLTSSYGGSGVWVYDLDDNDGDGASRFFDCDDGDATIGPLGVETPNGRDDDCNGIVDDLPTWWYLDADGDGYGDDSSAIASDVAVDGRVLVGGDCDDTNAAVNPDAAETCDGLDNNCDGETDEDGATDGSPYYVDADGDGYGTGVAVLRCAAEAGWATEAGDCNDGDVEVSPGADELCNGRDDNCDGTVDEDSAVDAGTWYTDGDSDGYGDPASAMTACTQPDGTIAVGGDCNDADSSVSPDAAEICDDSNTDENCNGVAEEAGAIGELTWYTDSDGDGYGDDAAPVQACDQPDGAVADATDCDDGDAATHPGAAEVCDAFNRDEDCNGLADDADSDATGTSTWYRDADGDGYGDASTTLQACDPVDGWVGDATDCDDAALSVHPGATEVPDDGIDQDCSGSDATSDGGTVTPGSKGCATAPGPAPLWGLILALAGLVRRRARSDRGATDRGSDSVDPGGTRGSSPRT